MPTRQTKNQTFEKLLLLELKKIFSRLSAIEDRLQSMEQKRARLTTYKERLIQLKVEKQSLINYIQELEKFNKLPLD